MRDMNSTSTRRPLQFKFQAQLAPVFRYQQAFGSHLPLPSFRPSSSPHTSNTANRKKQETQKVRAAEDLMLALKLFWGECAPKTSPRRRRVSFGATGENDISNSIREDSLGDVGSGRYDQSLWDDTETCRPRKYAEEELDRLINGTKSSKFFAPSSQEFSKSRRTPRRVPVRPNNAGRGLSKKTVVDRSASASLRTMRGQLVVSQRLNKW